MADYIKACNVIDLPSGNMKSFLISGKHITLAHVEENFFAVDDICTHAQCSLGSNGTLDSTTIICGCHGASFDVSTGKVLTPPATEDLRSYLVKVDGQSVLVLLS